MTPSDHGLKIAFIGSGGITGAHAAAVEAFPAYYNILATCDIHLPSAQRLAKRFAPNVPAFVSIEALYEEVGEELEGVIVCLPHFLHEPAAQFFLERGIPVLMEKPVTCNLVELNRLRELETERAFVQAGQMQRFQAESLWLKDYIQDEEQFGRPLSFDLNIWQNIEGYIQGNPNHWILDRDKAGGGICISVAVHPLDLLRFITGQDFTEVMAMGRFDPPFRNGAESSCSALLKMSGGLTGTLHASYKATRVPYSQRLVLFGERGSLYQIPEMGCYSGPYLAVSADPKITSFEEMYGGFVPIADKVEAAYPGQGKSAFVSQLLHFRASILEGRRPTQNTLAINHNTIAVLDAIATSLKSGQVEAVAQLV